MKNVILGSLLFFISSAHAISTTDFVKLNRVDSLIFISEEYKGSPVTVETQKKRIFTIDSKESFIDVLSALCDYHSIKYGTSSDSQSVNFSRNALCLIK